MGFGWSGERVRLVPLDYERHFENCLRWLNDPEVTEGILIGDLPITRLAEKEYFDKNQLVDPTNVSFAIETLDGRHVGQSGIHRINHQHGTAQTGSFIGDPGDRGKGLGTEACVLRAWYCFHVLGLRVIFSEYMEGNAASSRMQEKAGYLECGRKPKALWKRGAHRDLVMTVLTKERFFEQNPGWSAKR